MFKAGVSGNPRGRPKGATNRLHTAQIVKILEANHCNPFEILAQIATGEIKDYLSPDELKKFTPRLRMEAAGELCQYLGPKLKAMELEERSEPVQVIINSAPAPLTIESDKK